MATLIIVYALSGEVSVLAYDMPDLTTCRAKMRAYNTTTRAGIGYATCANGKLSFIKKG